MTACIPASRPGFSPPQPWPTGVEGVRDASNYIESVVARCPNTKLVLGGYSQGAAVMGFVTNDVVPDDVVTNDVVPDNYRPADGAPIPEPMPADVADHVVAVVLFGTPNARAMNFLGQPHLSIGPRYADKTVQLCVTEDAVCSDGLNLGVHNPESYREVIDEGAAYAAGRL